MIPVWLRLYINSSWQPIRKVGIDITLLKCDGDPVKHSTAEMLELANRQVGGKPTKNIVEGLEGIYHIIRKRDMYWSQFELYGL